jgi:hypothetical protein
MFTAMPPPVSGLSFSTNLRAHLQKTLSTITDKYFLWSDGTTALRLAYFKQVILAQAKTTKNHMDHNQFTVFFVTGAKLTKVVNWKDKKEKRKRKRRSII